MNAHNTKRKPGRPATGVTKMKVAVTLNTKLLNLSRKAAHQSNRSFSSFVEEAIRAAMGTTKTNP